MINSVGKAQNKKCCEVRVQIGESCSKAWYLPEFDADRLYDAFVQIMEAQESA